MRWKSFCEFRLSLISFATIQEHDYDSRRCRSTGMLACSFAGFVERHVRDAAYVDAGGREGAAAAHSAGESLVECSLLCNGSRADYIANPVWAAGIRAVV